MAEYEGKADSEICASCKFYYDDPVTNSRTISTGWCKRHPRLFQKDDDRAHRTNWCQYYEADMDKRDKLEKALAEAGMGDMPQKVDNRHTDIVDEKAVPEEPLTGATRTSYEDTDDDNETTEELFSRAVRAELTMMKQFLVQTQQDARAAIVAMAEADNNNGMLEAKGMTRAIAMLISQIDARMSNLATSSTPEDTQLAH